MPARSCESESDSDVYEEAPEKSKTVVDLIELCKNMKPEKPKMNFSELKTSLLNLHSKEPPPARSLRPNRKLVEDSVRELTTDISNFSKKLDTLLNCVLSILDTCEHLEARVGSLEERKQVESECVGVSYAGVVSQSSRLVESNTERVEKLEFLASETERKTRLRQITLTHPEINMVDGNLDERVKVFLTDKMGLSSRELDTNMIVRKTNRNNTALLTVSDTRFKTFLYRARTKLRSAKAALSTDLYLNDNLTSYNFKILMDLKRDRKRRKSDNMPHLESIYSFDGKVYVKKARTDSNKLATWVKDCSVMRRVMSSVDDGSNPATSNE